MGYKDPEKQRAYQREWIAKRRAVWFKDNGPCVLCGSLEELELDHIDPSTKVTHNVWSWSATRRAHELEKCRVLCRACHLAKSVTESLKGEARSGSKLNDDKVRAIRKKYKNLPDKRSGCRILSEEFDVSQRAIRRIITREAWKHVL